MIVYYVIVARDVMHLRAIPPASSIPCSHTTAALFNCPKTVLFCFIPIVLVHNYSSVINSIGSSKFDDVIVCEVNP